MFSSAKVRALETRMLSEEALERFLSARTSAEIIGMLGDYGGNTVKTADGRVDNEATLLSVLCDAFREIEPVLPDSLTVGFLQYKYDCNNIKAALKCRARGISPESMMIPLGTVDTADIIAAAESRDFSLLPENMAKAAGLAAETFAKTANPQVIDLLLDRACFADMLDAAERSGVPFSVGLVERQIDLTNAVMCVRVLRMKAGESGAALLSDALAAGGELGGKTGGEEFWLGLYNAGEEKLWETLKKSDALGGFAAACGVESSLAAIEVESERFIMSYIRQVRWMPFGAELSVAYLAALEYGIKNVRIIMAGKDAGLDEAVIRERLRDMYV